MAPYWSPGSAAPGAAGRARRASSAGSSSGVTAAVLGRKTSSAGEAYHRVVTGTSSSTRNPLYGMHGLGLADSVAGSASDDTSASSASASASRHYVDPWDLENFMYLKRHWAAEDAEGEASSTPALETAAQSDFYYVGPGLNGEVELDVVDIPAYRPDSVLLADEPLSLSVAHGGHALLNAVEEESFFNERYDPSRHHRLDRLVRRSHSAAATYLHQHREQPRAASAAANMLAVAAPMQRSAHAAYSGRRRSVACAPRYYRTPITGGDSSGEYEAFEDYADELSRRLGAVDLEPPPVPAPSRAKRHSVAGKLPPSHQMPRSRASIAGPAPSMAPLMASRLAAQPVRRRHSHCVGWPAPSPAPAPAPAHIYSTRRASFSRGQLLAGLHAVHAGRHATELAYGPAYGTPYGGSSDDCYVSDASEDLVYGEAPEAANGSAAGQQVVRRDAVVDGFTDADMVYAQLASSLYADSAYGYGYCGYGPASGDCSRFQLTNYGHLKIDYSCSWRSLDHYIAHS